MGVAPVEIDSPLSPQRPRLFAITPPTQRTTLSRTSTMQAHPTSATQAKDRNYMQLGNSLARLSRAVGQTADLCELLKVNLDAMKVLSATHAAQ